MLFNKSYLQKSKLSSGRYLKRLVVIALGATAISSCQKASTVGFADSNAVDVALLDTFTVSASTVLIDSLPTSGTSVILVGNNSDTEFGQVQAASFFHLGIPTGTTPDKNAVFDSVVVDLHYSGYHNGDTTQLSTIKVHQLTSILKLQDNIKYSDPDEQSLLISSSALYNKSTVPYNSTALGTKSFRPKPNSKDSVTIKLDNTFGSDLFTLLKNGDQKITDQEKFTNYVKGLAVIPTTTGNSIVGYNTSNATMRLYYSTYSTDGIKASNQVKFLLADSALQFNKITSDRSSSSLKNLTATQTILTSAETATHCFVQGGIGLVTKIQFPGILTFLQDKKYIINKASLVVRPIKNTNTAFAFPENLILYVGNDKNKPQSILAKSYDDGDQTIALQTNYDNIGSSVYVFNLTEYLSGLKSLTDITNTSLLLSLPTTKLLNSVDRLVIGGTGTSGQEISLQITYTKYDY
jgi:hypothetical protein